MPSNYAHGWRETVIVLRGLDEASVERVIDLVDRVRPEL